MEQDELKKYQHKEALKSERNAFIKREHEAAKHK